MLKKLLQPYVRVAYSHLTLRLLIQLTMTNLTRWLQPLWNQSVYGGGRSGINTESLIAQSPPRNSPMQRSKRRAARNSRNLGDNSNLIWFSIVIVGTRNAFATRSDDSLVSDTTTAGLNFVILLPSQPHWPIKCTKFSGSFVMLLFIENPLSGLQANSTGGTSKHSNPCMFTYFAASPNEENLISIPSSAKLFATRSILLA